MKKKSDSNSRDEQSLADEVIRLLDSPTASVNGESKMTDDQKQTNELGDLIRRSAMCELPESNPGLRDLLVEELDRVEASGDGSLQTVVKKSHPYSISARDSVWRWVAAVALLIGLTFAFTLNDSYRDSARRTQATNNFRQFGLSSLNYESAHEIKGMRKLDGYAAPSESWQNPVDNPSADVRKKHNDLPVFETAAVNSVVSVPDGGTVSLGGIKRFTEEQFTKQQQDRSKQVRTLESQESVFRAQLEPKLKPPTAIPLADTDLKVTTRSGYVDNTLESRDALSIDLSHSGPVDGPNVRFNTSSPEEYKSHLHVPLAKNKPMDFLSGGETPSPSALPALNESKSGPVEKFWRRPVGDPSDSMAISRGFGEEPKGFGNEKSEQLVQDQYGLTGGMMSNMLGEARSLAIPERQSREQYTPIHENKFVAALGGEAISTFSIDVDTAAYSNMRRFITSGQLPPRDSVRIEELVNYFNYDYPQPKADVPFSVNMELATCPWNKSHKLLRVGLKGKDIHMNERPATNVVFLLDVSGSMNQHNKLPLLKRGFQMMVNKLGENDRVSIVTYAGNAGVALKPTTGDQTKAINDAIERLTSGGSTHGSAGIQLAYELAQKNFIKDGVNKVILATDGDLNVGVTDDDALVQLIKSKASEGVFLTVLGFGTGNLQDGKMEKLADNGNGMYAYIDSLREAKKVLVEEMSGSLVTIAKDVKIQIEFNPAEVVGYRLVGYENRMLQTEDFDNDKKDAGEIGAGHTVTAIYELVTVDAAEAPTTAVAPQGMKYQSSELPEPDSKDEMKTPANLSDAATNGDLCTLALRYKQPDENTSKRIEFSIKNDEKSFLSASDDFRFASSVAAFGMILRGSKYAGKADPAMVQEIAVGAIGNDSSGYRAEFVDMVGKVNEICR